MVAFDVIEYSPRYVLQFCKNNIISFILLLNKFSTNKGNK